jgi:hypothetical protein
MDTLIKENLTIQKILQAAYPEYEQTHPPKLSSMCFYPDRAMVAQTESSPIGL